MEDLLTDISDARHVIHDFMHMTHDESAGYEAMFQIINGYLKSHAPMKTSLEEQSLTIPSRSPRDLSSSRDLGTPRSHRSSQIISTDTVLPGTPRSPRSPRDVPSPRSPRDVPSSDSLSAEHEIVPVDIPQTTHSIDVTTVNPTFHHLLHHDLGVICDDFLTAIHNFETDAGKNGKLVLGILHQVLKHFSWHDINVVMTILSDICSIISTITLPIYPPLSPIFAIVAAVAGGLSKVNYQQLYLQFRMICRWIESLIEELDRYLKVHYGPVVKRLFYSLTKL